MDLKRLVGSAVFMTAIPLFTNGCADDLCCSEFSAGADLSNVNFEMEGAAGAQYQVLAQASADLSGSVNAAVEDVLGACRNIARDLGATEAEITAEDAKDRDDALTGMCALATGKIEAGLQISASGKAELKIDFQAPKCEASFSAKANCQAKCDVSGSCNVEAKPPTCEGGKLVVGCEGSCTAEANAEFQCKGSCETAVSGSCTAQGGVECEGKCEGTCEASGEAGATGAQADGTCKGTCKGSCSATKPGFKCEGTFSGSCKGECKPPSAGIKVECDAKCSAKAEPLKCEGGTLKGGCEVDAKCDANCDASVSAKAECTPPSLSITASASGDVQAQARVAAVIDTLKVNLPAIIVVWKARGQAFVDLVGTISTSASGAVSGDLSVKGTACLLPIGKALADSATSIGVTLQASAKIGGAAGLK